MQLFLNKQTRSKRNPWSWTKRNISRSEDIKREMTFLKEYWPLTERQVYYRLISSKCIRSPHWLWKDKPIDIYAALGRMLKWMRIDDHIPYESITDEHRILTKKLGFSSAESFVDSQMSRLGKGYARCNAQKQDRYIEIWIEKATLLHIAEPVADEFCRRVVVAKGYLSVTFQADFYDRAAAALSKGEIPTVIYFGDWDPSGTNMIYAEIQTLTDELDLYGVEYHRGGINPDHFRTIDANPVPIKTSDSRAKKFIREHGTTCYELDALHPKQLETLIRKEIQNFTNMENYHENLMIEQTEIEKIGKWRDIVGNYGAAIAEDLGL